MRGDNMGSSIVVVGSLNMDIIVSADRYPKPGETIHGDRVTYLPGGKGANQAVGIKKLGGDVQMVGVVGDDVFGKQIVQGLSDYDLDTSQVRFEKNVATGIANIVHYPNNNSIIVIPGANAYCTPQYLSEIESVIANTEVLLLQLEIPLETVKFALELAKKHEVKTILNPAPASNLSNELLDLVDVITPNETELGIILDQEVQDIEAAFESWYSMHTTDLIVTLGEKGCAYWEKDQVKYIPAESFGEVKDTTGAGDAFNAAVAYGLAQHWSKDRAIAFAVKAASLSVTKFGAQPGMPYWDEIEPKL
ncbi:ribokinase [Aquibacillus albus]|uniref:Ribokinase n=1 Tax=Aquibacillus albus TaxID=1168171 RepID=A0ABS2N2Q6_9BACI|nr:ribokinase [Aquibacillus albus]MBM7572422.1 ribokinase [Aquibacillus albus]